MFLHTIIGNGKFELFEAFSNFFKRQNDYAIIGIKHVFLTHYHLLDPSGFVITTPPLGFLQTLMHRKSCLIPILQYSLKRLVHCNKVQ